MFLTNSTGFRGESIGNQWDINRLPPRIPGEFILDCMKTRFIEHTQDSIEENIGNSYDIYLTKSIGFYREYMAHR